MNKQIIFIGMKACGKSTVGILLAQRLSIQFLELDEQIGLMHTRQKKEKLICRDIFKKYGSGYFRSLESTVLQKILADLDNKDFVLSTGGGTPLSAQNRSLLESAGKIVYLEAEAEILLERILKNGVPSFFPFPDDPYKSLEELLKKREPLYQKIADIIVKIGNDDPKTIVNKIIDLI